jgi:hypothetical protein
MSAANDEIRVFLHLLVNWNGSIDRFEVFTNNLEDYLDKFVRDNYLPKIQTAYFERGTDCNVDLLDELSTTSQVKKVARSLYGSLASACQSS